MHYLSDPGEDGDEDFEARELSFSFPFAGSTYDVITIHTNGGLTLDLDIYYLYYEAWEAAFFVSGFADWGLPVLAGFVTDLYPGYQGDVYFHDFGDRAVVTWDAVAGGGYYFSGSEFLVTFQIEISQDGTIIYRWFNLDGDIVGGLDAGIVVGLSTGTEGVSYTGSNIDLSFGETFADSTLAQVWCYDEDPAYPASSECIYPGSDDNSGFDLEGETLTFMPNPGGGFTVAVPEPMTSTMSIAALVTLTCVARSRLRRVPDR